MIRIMILCVFILDYVVVIRLITWGWESAVDFQKRQVPTGAAQAEVSEVSLLFKHTVAHSSPREPGLQCKALELESDESARACVFV